MVDDDVSKAFVPATYISYLCLQETANQFLGKPLTGK